MYRNLKFTRNYNKETNKQAAVLHDLNTHPLTDLLTSANRGTRA